MWGYRVGGGGRGVGGLGGGGGGGGGVIFIGNIKEILSKML